jgi:hypothetical protein
MLKKMRQMKEKNLHTFLSDHDLTSRAVEYFNDALHFEVDQSLSQRKLVDLGRILGRVVTMELVIELGDRGFRSDLISNCLQVFERRVKGLLAGYRQDRQTSVVEDYVEGSAWLDYVQA